MATFVGHGTTVAITVVQAFVLVPLCLSALGAPLYGAWLAASEILVWVQLFDVGIPALLTQRVGAAMGRNDRRLAAAWSATGFALLAGLATVLVLAGLVVAPFVGGWLRVPAESVAVFAAAFGVAVAASGLLLLFNGMLGLARGVQQPAVASAAQVSGVLTGLLVSVGLLLAGWGLWALAAGLLSRAVVSMAGGVLFLSRLPDSSLWFLRPSRALAAEVRPLAPAMAGASAGLLLANNTEVLIVGAVMGPVPAAIYALTRRAIDGLRNLLDVFVAAAHGGFAHLVTAADRSRAREVWREIGWLRLSAACLCGAVALPVNHGFVSLLFGEAQYGGAWLTAAFVAYMIAGGHSQLANALLRAADRIREGSWLLVGEAVARVGAMLAGLWIGGLVAAAGAAAAASAGAWVINERALARALPASGALEPRSHWRTWGAPLAVVAVGGIVARWWTPMSWSALAITAGAGVAGGAAFLWSQRPAGVTWRGLYAGVAVSSSRTSIASPPKNTSNV